MISALGKSDATPSNVNHGADKYHQLLSAGSGPDRLIELNQIPRNQITLTREFGIERSRKEDDDEDPPMALPW
jgi:hypothetical protein